MGVSSSLKGEPGEGGSKISMAQASDNAEMAMILVVSEEVGGSQGPIWKTSVDLSGSAVFDASHMIAANCIM
jgi:hypothetical protein